MADITLALTGVSGTGAVGAAGASFSAALTGVSAGTRVGLTVSVRSPGQGAVLLMPGPQLQLTGVTGVLAQLDVVWPIATIRFTGLVSVSGTLSLDMPAARVQLTGKAGMTGQLALAMPTARLVFGGGSKLTLAMPRPRLALAGQTGSLATLRLALPRPRLALVGTAPVLGALRLLYPTPVMVFAGGTGKVGRLTLGMKRLTLAMAGVTGTLGTLVLRLPVVELSLTGVRTAQGTLDLVMPSMHLHLNGGVTGGVVNPDDPTGRPATLVMQVERGALTQYTNWHFNSYCVFNGVCLGANENGIFALTGDTDDGAFIDAAARVGVTDFGSSHIKRVERIYFGYRTDGRLILRVITDETATRDYAIAQPTPGRVGLHGTHASLGRGLEARYWQFEVRNDGGASFELDMMEMKPTKLRRRVGGGNA